MPDSHGPAVGHSLVQQTKWQHLKEKDLRKGRKCLTVRGGGENSVRNGRGREKARPEEKRCSVVTEQTPPKKTEAH